MSYTSGSHTVFHRRFAIVWITKYRHKMLEGALRQVCKELDVQIVSRVLSREHVQMFVEIPPHIAVSDVVRRVKRPRGYPRRSGEEVGDRRATCRIC